MVLQFNEIRKSYGEKEVLKGITFTAESGKALGLLGRNGAGKTTSIRILMGVLGADSGEILIDCKEIDRKSIKMGYLPEERGLYPKKKIIEQLVYFAQLKGMSKTDADASCRKWLDRLGMSEYRDQLLERLSKGNQQKIQLITALAHDPHIVILDEPFSGLDPVNAMLLKDVVSEEIERGKTVIFSSHQMNYIEEFCTDIAILHNGTIALGGALRDIKRGYPRNKLVIDTEQREKVIGRYGELCTVSDSGALIFTLKDEAEKKRIMGSLVTEFDIDGIRVLEPALSDIFVEYAGD